ncbi:CAP domain-containing protein [Halobaculum marinum]|nr:CAP domain-containing protein [Halobaculum sp. DT55]
MGGALTGEQPTPNQSDIAGVNNTPELPKYAHEQPDSSVNTPIPLDNKTQRTDVNVSKVESTLKQKVDEHRDDNDVGPLNADPRLAIIARHHSYDMAKRDFFAHTNPDNETYTDRLQQSDYACGGGYQNIGAIFWKANDTQTEEQLAEELLHGFMRSGQHNMAMIDPDMTTVGIGIYITEDRRTYVTMNLCNADPLPEDDS